MTLMVYGYHFRKVANKVWPKAISDKWRATRYKQEQDKPKRKELMRFVGLITSNKPNEFKQ